MVESDKKEFATLFYGAGEYYNKKVSKELLLIYFNSLLEYPICDIKKSVSKHLADVEHGNFFPKVCDIVRNSGFKLLSANDKGELAWAQVIRQIRATGSYGTLKLDDKQAIAAVRALGSWKQLCSSTESDMTWKKKEFMQIYQTYENTPLDMLPSSLPGLIDLQNHKKKTGDRMQYLQDGIKSFRDKNKLEHK